MTKIFIRAQQLVNVIKAIVESLSQVFTDYRRHDFLVGDAEGFGYSYDIGLELVDEIDHDLSLYSDRFPVLFQ